MSASLLDLTHFQWFCFDSSNNHWTKWHNQLQKFVSKIAPNSILRMMRISKQKIATSCLCPLSQFLSMCWYDGDAHQIKSCMIFSKKDHLAMCHAVQDIGYHYIKNEVMIHYHSWYKLSFLFWLIHNLISSCIHW